VADLPATITLIGHSNVWDPSIRASAAPWNKGTPHDPGRVVMAWLHHRSYGTLGIYLAQHPSDLRLLPPPRQWLQVRGAVQP
jgi:hypothetical protein